MKSAQILPSLQKNLRCDVFSGLLILHSEVNEAITLNRLDAFQVEYLRRVPNRASVFPPDHQPYYEKYGEQQVSSGHYYQVIRYREHLMPLAEALWREVEIDRASAGLQAR